MRFAPHAALAAAVLTVLGSPVACADGPVPVAPAAKPAERGSLGFQAVPAAAIPAQFRTQLGIADGTGVIAVNVVPGGPADAAGLKTGDVLLKVAGQDVPSTKDLDPNKPASMEAFADAYAKITGTVTVGTKVEIVVVRDGKPVTLSTTPVAERGYVGFMATPVALLNAKQRTRWNVKTDKGVVAVRVTKGSPAEKAGLHDGDVMIKYAGQDMPSTKDLDPKKAEGGQAFAAAFARIANTTRPGTELAIVVERDGKPVTLLATPLDFNGMQKIASAAGEADEDDEGDEGDEGKEGPEKAPAPK